ncbi:hypothetical protein [Ornithinimicrobium pekingense]|uniref:Uncharacterized protein n=1 Tax=Ornithinimicrobium pekingense TaxID=384677 RepID=A0ABQ2F8U5_9MICO|nr:hypothetical protein [Ornithinimicrobium pekingense]GGK72607.1 hypothetical protein GCM10011509_21490 [Ornithinimicrobium pekingense]
MLELTLLVALSLISLLVIGRAAGARGAAPADLGRGVARGAHTLGRVGASWRPVEHLPR